MYIYMFLYFFIEIHLEYSVEYLVEDHLHVIHPAHLIVHIPYRTLYTIHDIEYLMGYPLEYLLYES